jgi:hypothetical protein
MNTPAIRADTAARPPATRSAVTNGRRLHVAAPGDGAWARRFRDVLAEIVSDLGGAGRLSEGQRQIARRCAMLAVECEKIEGHAVAGEPIDLETYGQLTDRMGRAFQRLGLKRVAKAVPSLAEHLAALARERPPAADDDDNGDGLDALPADAESAT